MKAPFSGFWWIVAMLVIGAAMVIHITIFDGRFDPWNLLVPGLMLGIGLIQLFYKKR